MPATRKKNPQSVGVQKVRKLLVGLPTSLLKETDQLASSMEVTRTAVIRAALAEYVGKRVGDTHDKLLAEGYQQDRKLNREIVEDFLASDAENF
jgi:metal-responsive CopG/Arc/MetJ family transcriptional regulator